jgi:hypothetical protein
MKNLKYVFGLLLVVFLFPCQNTEAQSTRPRREKVVKVRTAKRKVRRHKRRVVRRTLRRLPSGTVAVMHRKVAYYPVGGMFYIAKKGVYLRAFPPRGFRLRVLPRASVRLVLRGTVYHYADGVFYQPIGEEFQIVRPPEGAVVKELPEDAEEIDFDGVSAYELNDAVYKLIEGGYEVIDVLDNPE